MDRRQLDMASRNRCMQAGIAAKFVRAGQAPPARSLCAHCSNSLEIHPVCWLPGLAARYGPCKHEEKLGGTSEGRELTSQRTVWPLSSPGLLQRDEE